MSETESSPPDRRPPFARKYPRDPSLDGLVASFVAGDYATVREAAPELADKASDPAVAEAARDLRRRLDPDPMAVWLLVGTGALLLFMIVWFYGHNH
jgi:hypothetical protein